MFRVSRTGGVSVGFRFAVLIDVSLIKSRLIVVGTKSRRYVNIYVLCGCVGLHTVESGLRFGVHSRVISGREGVGLVYHKYTVYVGYLRACCYRYFNLGKDFRILRGRYPDCTAALRQSGNIAELVYRRHGRV